MHKYYQIRWIRFMPLMVIALGLPMALQIVPPNSVYGLRTAATLASPASWYQTNHWAGLASVMLGCAALGGNLVIDRLSSVSADAKMYFIISSLFASVTLSTAIGIVAG